MPCDSIAMNIVFNKIQNTIKTSKYLLVTNLRTEHRNRFNRVMWIESFLGFVSGFDEITNDLSEFSVLIALAAVIQFWRSAWFWFKSSASLICNTLDTLSSDLACVAWLHVTTGMSYMVLWRPSLSTVSFCPYTMLMMLERRIEKVDLMRFFSLRSSSVSCLMEKI